MAAFTLQSAPPMLPVLSTTNTTSIGPQIGPGHSPSTGAASLQVQSGIVVVVVLDVVVVLVDEVEEVDVVVVVGNVHVVVVKVDVLVGGNVQVVVVKLDVVVGGRVHVVVVEVDVLVGGSVQVVVVKVDVVVGGQGPRRGRRGGRARGWFGPGRRRPDRRARRLDDDGSDRWPESGSTGSTDGPRPALPGSSKPKASTARSIIDLLPLTRMPLTPLLARVRRIGS